MQKQRPTGLSALLEKKTKRPANLFIEQRIALTMI